MPIDALPSPAAPNDDVATFNTKMFAWVAALQTWTTQANAVEAAVDADAAAAAASEVAAELAETNAEAAATSAQANAQAAAASAGASLWVSGTTYAIGERRWSPINQRVYRRLTAGAGTTDPKDDTTNWTPVPIELPIDVVTGTSATIRANVRTRCTNAAAVALTLPTLADGDVVEIDFENGRYDNSFDVGAQTIKGPNGTSATGVITHDEGGFISLYFNGTFIRSAQ